MQPTAGSGQGAVALRAAQLGTAPPARDTRTKPYKPAQPPTTRSPRRLAAASSRPARLCWPRQGRERESRGNAARDHGRTRMTGRARGFLLLALMGAAAAFAQQNSPHAAFVYPAGGRLGSTFEVTVGGQYLDGAKETFFAGDGVKAEILGFS